MRISERRLRRLIRDVIKESYPMRRNPEGKAVRLPMNFEDIGDMMDLLELKDIKFSYEKEYEVAPYDCDYMYILSANVKNPFSGSIENIKSYSNSIYDFNIDGLRSGDGDIKKYFINTFMEDFFKQIYQIFNPGKMSKYRVHKAYIKHEEDHEDGPSLISDLYDKVAEQILSNPSLKKYNDFESFIFDILKMADAGTL